MIKRKLEKNIPQLHKGREKGNRNWVRYKVWYEEDMGPFFMRADSFSLTCQRTEHNAFSNKFTNPGHQLPVRIPHILRFTFIA
jgi:hypothetical protein